MDPSTATLAWIAIAISIFSAVASFLALAQSAQLHPKPYFIVKVGREDRGDDVPVATFTITNIGHASGHDMNLIWRNQSTGTYEKVWHGGLIELPTSHPMETQISLVTGSTRTDGTDGYGNEIYPQGAPSDWIGEFELTWHQDPCLNKKKRRFWILTSEETNLFARPSFNNPVLRSADKFRHRLRQARRER